MFSEPNDIQQMENKAKKLSDDGKYLRSIAIISQVVATKKSQKSEDLNEYATKMAQVFNQFGMNLLNIQKFQECQQLFEKIVKMLKTLQGDDINQFIGLTLNNLSCSLKRNGQVKEAEQCLQQALKYQSSQKANFDPYTDNVTPKFERSPHQNQDKFYDSPRSKGNEMALTQLNMCAILSQRGDHQQALLHAKSSIDKLDYELNYLLQKIGDMNETQLKMSEHVIAQAIEKQSLLAIAFYNQGCQQEFLKMYNKSMESYKTANILEKSKFSIGGDQRQPPTQMQAEFEKSYREMRKKIQTIKTASTNSQAAYSQSNKRTFSGLDKKMVDQDSEYSRKFQTGTSSTKWQKKSVPFITMNQNSSKVSFATKHDQNYFLYQNLPQIQNTSNERKKRPMSAKNPNLQTKFIKNENSVPKLVEDLSKQVINEEDYSMIQLPQDELSNQPKSKARKIRPVSSYVQKNDKPQQDQMFVSAANFSQKLNDPSEKLSNIDSISNLGIKQTNATNDYQMNKQLNRYESQRGSSKISIKRNFTAQPNSTERSSAMPPRQMKSQTQTNFSSKVRNEAKKISRISAPHYGRRLKSSKSTVQPIIKMTQRRKIIEHSRGNFMIPSNQPIKAMNGDLNYNLIEQIDRNYNELSQMQSIGMKFHKQSNYNTVSDIDQMYHAELARQIDLKEDMRRLGKDIKKLDKQTIPAEVAIKQQQLKKRPQTAKLNTIKFNTNSIAQIEEQTISEKEEDVEEQQNEVSDGRMSGFQQLRYSISNSRSRSRSKSQTRHIKNKPSRERPRSAYTKTLNSGVTLQKINEVGRNTIMSKAQANNTRSQPSLGARIQSAGVRRNSTRQAENPYQSKRMRPQNHPNRINERSGPRDEIAEDSNSDTQMIYSGDHSNPSLGKSSSIVNERKLLNVNRIEVEPKPTQMEESLINKIQKPQIKKALTKGPVKQSRSPSLKVSKTPKKAMTIRPERTFGLAKAKPIGTNTVKHKKTKVDPTDFQKIKASQNIENFASDHLRKSMEKQKESIQETIAKSQGSSSPVRSIERTQPAPIDIKIANIPVEQQPQLLVAPKENIEQQPQALAAPKSSRRKIDSSRGKQNSARPSGQRVSVKQAASYRSKPNNPPSVNSKARVSKASVRKGVSSSNQSKSMAKSSVGTEQSLDMAKKLKGNPSSRERYIDKKQDSKFNDDASNEENQEKSVIITDETPKQPKMEPITKNIIQNFTSKIQQPEFKAQSLTQILEARDLSNRPDFNIYPPIDSHIPICDQLDLESQGTSGYKEGESFFDEEYYEEYQQWTLENYSLQNEYIKSMTQDVEVRQFVNNFEKYQSIKQQTELANKFYNPYNAIRDENKKMAQKEQTMKKIRDIQEVETQQNGDTLLADIREKIFTYFKNVNYRDQMFSQQSEMARRLGVIGGDFSSAKDLEKAFTDMAYTGQIKDLLIPIREDNIDENLDRDRADAIFRFREFPRLQVDQGAYVSERFGLCHLIFILQTKCHKLQIQLYAAETANKDVKKNLKLNREVNLLELGIKKPIVQMNNFKSGSLENNEDPSEQYKINSLQIVKAIRNIKKSFKGELYQDFYSFGEPSSEDTNVTMWHGFQINFMDLSQLQHLVSQNMVSTIKRKFQGSAAYIQLLKNFDGMNYKKLKNKQPIERLAFAQNIIKKRIKKRYMENLKRLMKRKVVQSVDNLYLTVQTFQIRRQYMSEGNQKQIFLILKVKLKQDKTGIMIEGTDVNPVKKQRVKISPSEIQISEHFCEVIIRNWDFFIDNLKIDDQVSEGQCLSFSTSHMSSCNEHNYRLQLQHYESNDLEKLEIEENHFHFHDQDGDQSLCSSPQSQARQVNFEEESPRKDIRTQYSNMKTYKILDHGMSGSQSPSKRRVFKTSNRQYNEIFDHRDRLRKQKDFFKSFKIPKKTENMWKYNIKNHFEFYVLKIQLWWKAVVFFRLLKHLLKHNKVYRDAGIDIGNGPLAKRMAAVESEQNMEKIQLLQQTLKIKGSKREMDMITDIQKIFRLKKLMKQAKDKFLKYANKDFPNILYKTVREFYDNPKYDVHPNNFMILIQKDQENYGKFPSFIIRMILNNKPEKVNQEIEISHNFNTLKNGVAENQFFIEQHSQDHYFRNLLDKRLKFRPYTPMELKKMQKSHKLKSMDVQKNNSVVSDVVVSKTEEAQDDNDYSGLPRGEYYIDDIIRYTMEVEKKEKKMQQEKQEKLRKKHESDILFQQEQEKLKFKSNVEEVKKEDTQTTGFFGNAIGKIKQKFFGNDEMEGQEEEEGEYEQSELEN